jgi:cell division protein FtsW (lipid II flippase)
MASSRSAFSRSGRLAWAGIGIYFASLVAIGLAVLVPSLGTCQMCGVQFDGTICSGSSAGGCGGLLALAASGLVALTGLCLLTALNASAAYRAKRGARVVSFLDPAGRPSGAAFQVASLTLLAEGPQLLGIGLVVPLLQPCREGCPIPYSILGLQWAFIAAGILLFVAGALGFVTGRERLVLGSAPPRGASPP